jgi:hypothetical protein
MNEERDNFFDLFKVTLFAQVFQRFACTPIHLEFKIDGMGPNSFFMLSNASTPAALPETP